MRGFSTKITKTLVPMSTLTCADNSGAIQFRIINKLGKGHRHAKLAAAGICDIVIASVIKGTPAYLKKPVRVVIIRQKAPIRRSNGMRVRFEDNAGIMIGEDNLPIGTEIKGVMAREVIERFVKVGGIASKVI
ncbi:MAG: uL14 family ribosomal protein [Candidatus Micrarchaeales archaeon]|jgi:large subunit ribosomal protein L14